MIKHTHSNLLTDDPFRNETWGGAGGGAWGGASTGTTTGSSMRTGSSITKKTLYDVDDASWLAPLHYDSKQPKFET